MTKEAVLATGVADEDLAQRVFDSLVAQGSSDAARPARVTLTIELGTLNPEVFKALQLFVTAAVSGGPAVGASRAGPTA